MHEYIEEKVKWLTTPKGGHAWERVPMKIIIPPFYGSSKPKQLQEGPLFLLSASDKGWLTVHRDNKESFRVERREDILKLFPDKYNWTFSKDNELECIFKPFGEKDLMDLYYLKKIEVTPDYEIQYYTGTGKIILRHGQDYRYLIDIKKFCYKKVGVNTFEELSTIVQEFLLFNSKYGINLNSFMATSKDYILDSTEGEFGLIKNLTTDDLDFLRSCAKPGRMDTSSLGTIANTQSIDMRRAHLNYLASMPTLLKSKTRIARGAKTRSKEAHPGSCYLVEVNVPKDYSNFLPIPFRAVPGGGTYYPYGKFITHLSGPYLDILDIRGDIQYTILDSLEFIQLYGEPKTSNFYLACNAINTIEDEKDKFPHLNLKLLHIGIVGNMTSVRQKFDPREWELHSSNIYNPIVANAVQAQLARDMWILAESNKTIGIRVDALTGKDLPLIPEFKTSKTGKSLILTPYAKDLPGEAPKYLSMVEEYRHKRSIKLSYTKRNGLSYCIFFGGGWEVGNGSLGHIRDVEIELEPTATSRLADSDYSSRPMCKTVGDLLTNEFPTTSPSLEQLGCFSRNQVAYKLEEFFNGP